MKTHYAKNRAQWRIWLKKNHQAASEIWLVFYKKHTGKPNVLYDEAVEEGLCFGWVDSIVKRIDDDRYAQKFSPRKPGSAWSISNIQRMKKMIAAGKVTDVGLQAFAGHKLRVPPAKPTTLPADLGQHFRRRATAWRNFERFPPGYKRMAIGWVASAKREDTRRKRLDRLIVCSARNERIESM